MANIFGQGKPSGALGGSSYAREEQLQTEERRTELNRKQAEFHEWLDAAESRAVARERQMTEDRAIMEEQPSKTQANIATNELTEVQADADREFTPMAQERRIRQYKREMPREALDDIGGVWSAARHQLAHPKANKKAIYKQARQALLELSGDPEGASPFLDSIGIGEEYSDKALHALEMFGSVGIHDIKTSRAEHLMAHEYSLKIREAMASRKAPDLTTGETKQTTVNQIGDILSEEDWFSNLEGKKQDDGTYSGAQGAVAAAIATRANASRSLYLKQGIAITPEDTAGILMEMVSTMPELFVTDDAGYNSFNAVPFQAVSGTVIGQVADIMMTDPTAPSFMDTWTDNKRWILPMVKNSYQTRALEMSGTLQRQNALNTNIDATPEATSNLTSPTGPIMSDPYNPGPTGLK